MTVMQWVLVAVATVGNAISLWLWYSSSQFIWLLLTATYTLVGVIDLFNRFGQ